MGTKIKEPSRPIGPLQRALTKLEKSQSPLRARIEEASEIIGLDESVLTTDRSCQEEIKRATDISPCVGRDEWALRWLLKTLDAQGDAGRNARAQATAWRLFNILICRLPAKNVARLLSAHKFLEIFHRMVEEAIHDQAAMAWQDDSDSSMTLAESPDMPTPSWTRKRKRPIGSEEEGLNELWAMGQRQDAGKSAYLALSALLELSNGGPRSYHGGKGAYEKEYIKSVFRVDPALAAQLLGSSLKMIRVLYAEDLGSSPGEDDVSYLGNVMHPAVQAWNNRSGLFDDLQGRTSDKAFATRCLVPALLLLEELCRAPRDRIRLERLISPLEKALAAHIFIPTRAFFLEADEATSGQDDGTSVQDGTYLLRDYLSTIASAVAGSESDDSAGQPPAFTATGLLRAIPRLMSTAARCPRSPGYKGRVANASWLEAVLRVLVEIAGISSDDNASLHQNQLEVLEGLLQVAIDRNIKVGTNHLQQIAISHGNLSTEGKLSPKWNILGKMIELDPDVFLIPKHSEHLSPKYNEADNPLLEALFDAITAAACVSRSSASEEGREIQQNILLPLMGALAKARKLSTFLQLWLQGLEAIYQKRFDNQDAPEDAQIPIVTFMESEQVFKALRDLLEKHWSTMQITEAIESILIKVEASRVVDGKAQVLARLLLIEAICSALSRDDVLEAVHPQAVKVYQVIIQLLCESWRDDVSIWALWRLLERLCTLWPGICQVKGIQFAADKPGSVAAGEKSPQHPVSLSIQFLTSMANSGAASSHTGTYLQAYQGCRAALALVEAHSRYPDPWLQENMDRVDELLRLVVPPSKSHGGPPRPHGQPDFPTALELPGSQRWNGDLSGLSSKVALSIALAAALVSRFPSALTMCTHNTRESLFHALYIRALHSAACLGRRECIDGLSDVYIWQGILDSEYILNSSLTKKALLKVLIEQMELAKLEQTPVCPADLLVNSLLKIPATVFAKDERDVVLDLLLLYLLQAPNALAIDKLPSQISLIVKLTRAPNAAAKRLSGSDMWQLASKLGGLKEGLDEVSRMGFEEFVSLTIKQHISSPESKQSQKFFRSCLKRMKRYFRKSDGYISDVVTLGLVKRSLGIFLSNPAVLGRSEEDLLNNARWLFFKRLALDISESVNSGGSKNPLLSCDHLDAAVEAVAEIPGAHGGLDPDFDHPDRGGLQERLRSVVNHYSRVGQGDNPPSIEGSSTDGLPPVSYYKLLAKLQYPTSGEASVELCSLLGRPLTKYDRMRANAVAYDFYKDLVDEQRLACLQRLVQDGAGINDGALLCLRIALLVDSSPSAEAKTVVSSVYRSLCRAMQTCKIRSFRLITDCMESMLLTKKWAVSQWDIELTLSTVITMVSPNSPALPHKHAGLIYLRLCTLIHSIIINYRVRLRGRYHIVLPLLQPLLWCLFVPHRPITDSIAAGGGPPTKTMLPPPRPSWLPPPRRHTPLGSQEATSFARILTSLFDPTPASVTRHRLKRNRQQDQVGLELTPATDRARRLSGEHLCYLLIDYAQNHLHSRLTRDVKEALLPGIYALLDTVTQDTLRMVNAAMDQQTKDIFRTVYSSWETFGRGK